MSCKLEIFLLSGKLSSLLVNCRLCLDPKVEFRYAVKFVSLNEQQHSINIELAPFDNRRLANLCGRFDEHLRQIEQRLSVEIINRGGHFQILGSEKASQAAVKALQSLYQETAGHKILCPTDIHLYLQQDKAETEQGQITQSAGAPEFILRTRTGDIKARTPTQYKFIKNIFSNDINFGIGPAGTGKTFLAVACAVQALEQEKIRRILLIRPAVEAGEKLGFLPGDLAQKIDPYLRPLYDALYEMLGAERVARLLERQIIELAPLAYMRGRTLNDAFIILDESQNTTPEQMKMFLTRIGFGSTAVITGDMTQIDLPRGRQSGLAHALSVLQDIKGMSFTHFDSSDVVRHPIVQRIVEAYERHQQEDDNDYYHMEPPREH